MQAKPNLGRRVGVEIEFAGVDVDSVAACVAETFDGEIAPDPPSRYERRIFTPSGDFVVELDADPLKRWARRQQETEPGALEEVAGELVDRIASEVVPIEVVAPPIPRGDMHRLDTLVSRLAERGARGTYEALRFGFGVHFNPEVSAPEPDSVLSHMRSFALLYETIVDEFFVNGTRKWSGYIEPWPSDYIDTILDEAYAPASFATLIDDHLSATTTRNHALDMLPLFAHLDEPRVRAAVDDERVKSRPTYHYRLCNSRVGEADWQISQEWQSWRRIEALASNPRALRRAMREPGDSAPLAALGGARAV